MRRGTDKFAAVCAAICILCLAVVVTWGGTVLDTNRQANKAKETANQNRRVTRQIQHERARNIGANCAEQNRRHDNTVDTLNRLVLQRLTHHEPPRSLTRAQVQVRLAAMLKLADPPVRSQIQQSIASTVLLIEALAPKHDCRALVARQVNTK